MKKKFGEKAFIYEIVCGDLRAFISDHGATVVSLFVPDKNGNVEDICLGFDCPEEYTKSGTFFGATVGRNANRTKNAQFVLNGETIKLGANDGKNNLHSGFDFFKDRLWNVENQSENSITLSLNSPDGDQGFPGNAYIKVTYTLNDERELAIEYEAKCDKDTAFNFTNHSYFNLAGHQHTERAMEQTLEMPARFFNPDDAENIPTGELRSVENTPMDFRTPKPIGRDIDADYEPLKLQFGYDHNFEVYKNPCAILRDIPSGREMEVYTDCPGIQLYAGNFIDEPKGKGGISYPRRSGICLETQFYPDSLNHPEWPQPITKAGETYKSVTRYRFK